MTWEESLPLRIAAGLAFFLVLALIDWCRNPANPRRAKEYAFLGVVTLAAAAFGVGHDHATATISPEYFLDGKELARDPRPFRVAVTLLAIRGTYWVGLILGVALLIANNPSPARLQLGYRELARLALLPLGLAVLAGALGGALFDLLDPFALRPAAREIAGPRAAGRFLVVWGVHWGSYVGGALGGVAAVAAVRVRRGAPPRP